MAFVSVHYRYTYPSQWEARQCSVSCTNKRALLSCTHFIGYALLQCSSEGSSSRVRLSPSHIALHGRAGQCLRSWSVKCVRMHVKYTLTINMHFVDWGWPKPKRCQLIRRLVIWQYVCIVHTNVLLIYCHHSPTADFKSLCCLLIK